MNMIIDSRFEVNKIIKDSPLEIYQGHDLDKQCNVLLIKIDGQLDARIDQSTGSSKQSPHDPKLNGIITPYRIIEDNKDYFAVFPLPKGTILKKNIAIMNQLGEPFQEAEIVRIGHMLCKLAAEAESHNLIPLIRSDLVVIAVDSDPSLIAMDPDYLSETTATDFVPPQRAIAVLLKEMAAAGYKGCSNTTPPRRSHISSNLKKILQSASSKNSPIGNIDELSQALNFQAKDRRYLKSFVLLCLGVLILIGALFLSRFYARFEIIKQDQAVEKIRRTAADSKSTAYATADKLKVLMASQRIETPQQAIDAEYLLARGDQFFAKKDFDQAQLTYRQAIVLYESAIKLADEIAKLRIEAQEARELMRLSQTRWRPLNGSSYIRFPEQIERAGDTALEGESQYLKDRYREAAIAYELATQLYNSVSPKEYNELLYRHRALTAQDRATFAKDSWEKLRSATNSIFSAWANQAKAQMATAKGLLAAGKNAEAASHFVEAAELFETATKTAIEEMGAKTASALAYERAIAAAKRWQKQFKAMKKEVEPDEIVEAKKALERAHRLAGQNNYKQAVRSYEHAAEQYESQIRQLHAEAEALADHYTMRTEELISTLHKSQKKVEDRLTVARTKLESIQIRISQHHEPGQHEQLLKDSAAAQELYRHINKLSDYCNAKVYGGEANEKAHSLFRTGRALVTEGQYIEASIALKDAVEKFTTLVALPAAIDTSFSKEEQALGSREVAMKVIGPVGGGLPEIMKLLDLGDKSISAANEFLLAGKFTDATRSLEDAKLAFDSLIPQAEIELINHAVGADSEMRTEIALAALEELLILNPEHLQARELMTKIQSTERPKKRITIVQGKIRNDGRIIPFSPTEQGLAGILGEPSRVRANHMGLLFDEQGIVATPDPETKRILSIVVYYAKPLYENEPKDFYPGIVEIEGVSIGRDDSIEKINGSLKHLRFEPTPLGNSYKATHMGLRILINYKKGSSQIYSIGMLFLPNPNS